MDLTHLKKEFQERPLEMVAVGTAAVLAAAKVLDTIASVRSKNAYAKMAKRNTRRK